VRHSLFYLLIISSILTACSEKQTEYSLESSSILTSRKLETLYAFDLDDNSIKFSALSNGCTRSQDFKLIYHDKMISIMRLRPDLCKVTPRVTEFSLNHRLTNIKASKLSNPLIKKDFAKQKVRSYP